MTQEIQPFKPFYVPEEDEHLLFHPIRKVTLMDGSCVYVDRVTGITCSLDEQLEKVEELEEKWKKRFELGRQIDRTFLKKDM